MERFIFNETVYLGANSRSVLGSEIINRGFNKVLLVTDQTIEKVGLLKKVEDVLVNSNIQFELYKDIQPNPTIQNVLNGLDVFKKSKADVIVANRMDERLKGVEDKVYTRDIYHKD